MAEVRVAQIGSWPGSDVDLALRISLTDSPDLPVLPELPGRGAHAGMIGRATALLPGLDFDLQPAGWRLHQGTGHDQRRARQLFRDDLDRLEEQAQGYVGPLKFSVAGPWTLAATLERPRGDKVLADHGARREVAASLSAGISELTDELRRRMPDIEPVWQLDEPLLPAVRSGRVSTASGFSRHRTVDVPELVGAIEMIMNATEVTWWLHSCAAGMPYAELQQAPVDVFSFDESLITAADWDVLGAACESGRGLALGGGATSGSVSNPDQLARRVLRRFETLGLESSVADRWWLTPTCGLAGRTEPDAVRTLRALRSAADIVNEELGS
ncbi:hypothetical protein ACQCX2_06210 [Propionibacteriaceae bacterium Y1700]|uniref:hypothetical protein n=1 Tax=Microlunatus sp. Y1700 TaxID=3418487 RepID=UPI003DA71E42